MDFGSLEFKYLHFQHSKPLRSSTCTTGGLCSDIPVRRNANYLVEDLGAIRAQQDWIRCVGSLANFRGLMSPRYSLMQVAVPECLPERLEIIAYASEIGFLYDDATEFLSNGEVTRSNTEAITGFRQSASERKQLERSAGIKMIQDNLFISMSAIDTPRAKLAFEKWIEFLQESAGRQHNVLFETYDEYMAYRVLDIGEMFWFGLVVFGMGLSVQESEIPLLRKLSRPCWLCLVLQNDLCSYEKEVRAAKTSVSGRVVNVLEVLARERGVSIPEARRLCLGLLNEQLQRYKVVLEGLEKEDRLSSDAKVYLEALVFTVSGDAVWSLDTPRYNLARSYNSKQTQLLSSLRK